jgi:hypothetical protein
VRDEENPQAHGSGSGDTRRQNQRRDFHPKVPSLFPKSPKSFFEKSRDFFRPLQKYS